MKKTLKFLSWMFVAVLSVLSFSSCSDDDEGHPYAGTVWEYEDIYESGTITTLFALRMKQKLIMK